MAQSLKATTQKLGSQGSRLRRLPTMNRVRCKSSRLEMPVLQAPSLDAASRRTDSRCGALQAAKPAMTRQPPAAAQPPPEVELGLKRRRLQGGNDASGAAVARLDMDRVFTQRIPCSRDRTQDDAPNGGMMS